MTTERVTDDLAERGLAAGKIQVLGEPQQFKNPGAISAKQSAFEADSTRELEKVGATRLEVEAYLNGLRQGRTLVIASLSGNPLDVIARTMNLGGVFDVEGLMARNHTLPAWYSKDKPFPRWV